MSSDTEFDSSCTLPTLVRSRSSQDISSTLIDPDMSFLKEVNKFVFLRQNCIRKRTSQEPSTNRHSELKKFSSEINDRDMFVKDCEARRPSVMSDVVLHKSSKNSILFSAVKDAWKSLKKDVKEKEDETVVQHKTLRVNGMFDKKLLFVEDSSQKITDIIKEISETIINNIKPIIWNSIKAWEDIVNLHETFTKTEQDLQAAVWELITTEASCLNFLWIIVEIYIPVFKKLQERFEEIVNIDSYQLFGNIEDIFSSHIRLWETCISLPLLKSRLNREKFDISLMENGFLSISSIMHSYKVFMQLQLNMTRRIQEYEKSNTVFKEYVKWTKSYTNLYRDGILSIVSVPFQRITKYKLLLDRIKCFTNAEQSTPLNQMISSVHSFLENINTVVIGEKSLDEINSKLVPPSPSICDFVDITKLIEDKYLVFNLTKSLLDIPERILIHSGTMKMRLSNNKKQDVDCYLFNDLFLICKSNRRESKLTIYKSPIRIDKFVIKEESENSFLGLVFNDFSIIEWIVGFLGEPDEIKLWIEKCHKTRFLFQSKYEGTLKIPNKFFSQTAQAKTTVNQKSIEEKSGKTIFEDNISGYSTCRDSLEFQISNSSEELSLMDDQNCLLLQSDSMTEFYSITNGNRSRLIS